MAATWSEGRWRARRDNASPGGGASAGGSMSMCVWVSTVASSVLVSLAVD